VASCSGGSLGGSDEAALGHERAPPKVLEATAQVTPTASADILLEALGEGEGEPVGGLVASAELGREIAGEGEAVEEALDERVEARSGAMTPVEEADGELVDLGLGLELERADGSAAADGLSEVEKVTQTLDRRQGVGEALIGEHLGRAHRL